MSVATARIVTPARFSREKKAVNAFWPRPLETHDRPAVQVVHQREKAMQLADMHLVNRQPLHAAKVRPAAPLQSPLINLGDGVPRQIVKQSVTFMS